MATKSYKQPSKVQAGNAYGATKAADLDMSVGNVDRSNQTEKIKTTGIKTRGNGAAQRGVTARGPMA